MPLPKTRDVGKIIKFLKKDKPKMKHKQRIAISLSQARKQGADIPQKEGFINSNLIQEEITLSGVLKELGGIATAVIVNTVYKIKTGKLANFYTTILSYLGGKVASNAIYNLIEKLKPSDKIKKLAKEIVNAKSKDDMGKVRRKQNQLEKLIRKEEGFKTASIEADKLINKIKSKIKQEEYHMNTTQEFRNFIQEDVEVLEDMDQLKDDLREDIEEMTISQNIDITPPEKTPGSDFKKDKLPGERDKAKHKVKEKDVEDIDDTDDDERTGYSGTQPGNAEKTPIGEDERLSDEELIEMVDEMNEEEFDAFVDTLDEEEAEALEDLLNEEEYEEIEEGIVSKIASKVAKIKPFKKIGGKVAKKTYKASLKARKARILSRAGTRKMMKKVTAASRKKALARGMDPGKVISKWGGRSEYTASRKLLKKRAGEAGTKAAQKAAEKATKVGLGVAGGATVLGGGALAYKKLKKKKQEDIELNDLYNTIYEMSEEEYNDFIDGLSEEETQYVENVLDEYEEPNTDPEEIDASHPPEIGSEDEARKSVDKDLDTPQEKKHVAKQVDIMGDGDAVGNVPEDIENLSDDELLEVSKALTTAAIGGATALGAGYLLKKRQQAASKKAVSAELAKRGIKESKEPKELSLLESAVDSVKKKQ